MSNQAASFNRCLFKVQDMQSQIKAIKAKAKQRQGFFATNELQYLMDFNASITQAVAKTMEHLTDFVCVSMGNLTLARRNSYLTHVKTGIKPDTLPTLRTAPLQAGTLFPDSVLKCAEDDIADYESKGQSTSLRSKGRYHPYERCDRKSDKRSYKPAWKSIGNKGQNRKSKGRSSNYSS